MGHPECQRRAAWRCLVITAGRRRHDCSGKPGRTTPYTICPRPVDAQLASLKKTSEWERAAFIKKGGWDTLSGLKETVTGAANLCAQLLVTEKVPAAKTAAASG